VVVEHGVDRAVLERLGLRRAVALAAVGSDEFDNIAVAIAANAVSADTRVVLRAGEQEAIAETRSLLPLGVTRDVLGLAARSIADELRAVADADPGQALRSAASPTARPACCHD
jgi:Trk K+ transport system NAD-binding subunit